MFGYCIKCNAVATDGLCAIHGATQPMSHVTSPDIHPLSNFEKEFINERLDGTRLGEGLFLIYSDRMYRRKVITLDRPLVEIRLLAGSFHVKPLVKGHFQGMNPESVVKVNRNRTMRLAEVSRSFAAWELRDSKNAVISFSGGKDSVVLLDLLRDFNLKCVLIDTRLEFPETYNFIRQLKAAGQHIDVAKAANSFFTLCNYRGFPEHGNRWCCKTQKFEPFKEYIKANFGDENILVFSGERRSEGLYRINQPMKKPHKHITNQVTVQPLLDWLSLDVWSYIWQHQLPTNQVYQYFDRAGCWLCPFGLEYRIFLLQYTHPKLYKALAKIGFLKMMLTNGKARTPEPHRPCTMSMNGKTVKTCKVYGHLFINGFCFRCGKSGPSTTV